MRFLDTVDAREKKIDAKGVEKMLRLGYELYDPCTCEVTVTRNNNAIIILEDGSVRVVTFNNNLDILKISIL